MGEAFTGLWEGKELITERLSDYARHDLAHVGGVSAGRKITTLCEPYGILTAWHGSGNISPIAHMANRPVSLSTPNFGIQEYARGWDESMQEVFTAMPRYADGHVTVSDKPGLGIDVNEKAAAKCPYKRFLRPMIRREPARESTVLRTQNDDAHLRSWLGVLLVDEPDYIRIAD